MLQVDLLDGIAVWLEPNNKSGYPNDFTLLTYSILPVSQEFHRVRMSMLQFD